jgi:hypothetical protein
MKYLIRFLSCLPGLGTGIAATMSFVLMFDIPAVFVPLFILNAFSTIYLLCNTDNIAQNIYELFNLLSGKYDN